jgi:hypothetical protein
LDDGPETEEWDFPKKESEGRKIPKEFSAIVDLE